MTGNKKSKGGFTITELIVAVAVFALVITAAVSLLTMAVRTQRRALAIQDVQDNGRYLMGFIAKEVRMSEINNSDGQATVLSITHPDSGDISYSFTGTQITRNGDTINSDEVEVEGKFYVDGRAPGGDDEQARVTIVMKVKTTGAKTEERTEADLQTTLSQRDLY